jgi:hypothetical protein
MIKTRKGSNPGSPNDREPSNHLIANLRRRERGSPTETLAATLGRCEPGDGAFTQDVTFELCDGSKDWIEIRSCVLSDVLPAALRRAAGCWFHR